MSALELAERAVAAAPVADGVLATVTRERWQTFRFARSRPTQATAVADETLEVAALVDGRVGRAATNVLDADGIRDCAARAVAAAEATARRGTGEYPGFPAPGTDAGAGVGAGGFDPETAAAGAGLGGAALTTAFEVTGRSGAEAHGIWSAGDVETAIASSSGVAIADRVTDAFMKVTAIAPGGRSGYASQTSGRVGDIEPERLAEVASRKAVVAAQPGRIEPGEHPVVLEPQAVAELLYYLGVLTFNGLAHAEGRSAVSGRIGERVAAPGIRLAEAPSDPRTIRRAFDAEGVAKRGVALIEDGVAAGVVHDTTSAALAGSASTGHALEPGGSLAGPVPTNLVLEGGEAGSVEELCAPVERGVYVTRLWYVNPVRPAETLLTGVTRDGTFLIEGGRVTEPLQDLRFTDSALGILDRTEALTSESRLTSDGEMYDRRFAHGSVCPALRASSMRFTA